MRVFWKLVLKLAGWPTDIIFPYHHLKKYIVLIGPHTSNWDFILGVAYRSILKMETTRFLGKKELFRPPFGILFKLLGGYPVDRHARKNMVDEVVDIFNAHDTFSLALSPEGTRGRVEKLRTGFYHIARQANVPIVLVGMDYKQRRLFFSEPFMATNQDEDFARIVHFYRPIHGLNPDQGMMHL